MWKYRMFIMEFLCTLILSIFSILSTICSIRKSTIYIAPIIISLSNSVLIYIFRSCTVAHMNPLLTIGDYTIRVMVQKIKYDVYILIGLIISQLSAGFIGGHLMVFMYNSGIEDSRCKYPIKCSMYTLYLELILSGCNTLISLNCKRTSISSPIISGLYTAASCLVGERPSINMFNPINTISSGIAYGCTSNIGDIIVAECIGGFIGTTIYIIVFC